MCTTTILTLEPCALNAEFHHFILRFNKNFLILWIPLKEQTGAQRQGDFMDNSITQIFLSRVGCNVGWKGLTQNQIINFEWNPIQTPNCFGKHGNIGFTNLKNHSQRLNKCDII
jgi:hypothetical protein